MVDNSQTLVVIVTTYNRLALAQRAVSSVIDAKGHHNWVHILVVDDGSDGDTAEQLEKAFAERSFITVYPIEENAGCNHARQVGLSWVTRHYPGAWVSYLDDDDILVPTVIDEFDVCRKTHNAQWFAFSALLDNGNYDSKFPKPGFYNYLIDTMGKRRVTGDFQDFFNESYARDLAFSTRFKNAEEWVFWSQLAHRVDTYIPGKDGVHKVYLAGGLSQGGMNRDKRLAVAQYKAEILNGLLAPRYYSDILRNVARALIHNKQRQSAIAVAKQAIATYPLNIKAYLCLFRSYFLRH